MMGALQAPRKARRAAAALQPDVVAWVGRLAESMVHGT